MDRAKGEVGSARSAWHDGRASSSEEIREDIGKTRSEMDATLDELDRRLSLSYWTDEILGRLRSNPEARREAMDSLKSAGLSAAEQLRRHPWPALLIGGGVAWWIAQSGSSESPGVARGSLVDARTGEPYPGREEEAYGSEIGTRARMQHKAKEMVRRSGDRAAEMASDITASAESAVRQFGSKAKAHLSSAGHSVGSSARAGAQAAGRQVRSGASYGGHQLMAGGRRVSSATMHAFRDSPWSAGMACLGLGMLAGALIPATGRENAWMGEASDRLREKASETLQKGQEIASASLDAARHEAERQGLTGQEIRRQAGEMASRTKEALREEGRGAEGLQEKVSHVVEAATDEARRKAEEEGLAPRAKTPDE